MGDNKMRRHKSDWQRFISATWIYFSVAGVLFFTWLIMVLSHPSNTQPQEFITILRIPFIKAVPSIFLVMVGFAWVIHGTGFPIFVRHGDKTNIQEVEEYGN